jgi:hypothetical protein
VAHLVTHRVLDLVSNVFLLVEEKLCLFHAFIPFF